MQVGRSVLDGITAYCRRCHTPAAQRWNKQWPGCLPWSSLTARIAGLGRISPTWGIYPRIRQPIDRAFGPGIGTGWWDGLEAGGGVAQAGVPQDRMKG
ncbi:MAG: hypothetical protein IPM82_26940 [Saprospiraceae bacterium]|nr:hypothetical protein [Saprospiraceae bacterium]